MRGHRPGSIASAAALAALLAAGCFSDRGIALEVEVGDTGATTVELYLGATRCDPAANTRITCKSIAPPPDGKVALAGEIWFRDGPEPERAQVKGGKATFQLRADAVTTLPIVVAVGLPSAESTIPLGVATLRDLTIPVHGARVVATTLAATTTAQPAANLRTGDDRVLVWRKMRPRSSCVMVEHGGTSPVSRDFVVPVEDPDCDDIDDTDVRECNPAAYHGSNQVGGARDLPGCFTQSGGPACVLGAFGCQDDMPGNNDNTCSPLASRICVPSAFCGCTSFDETCTRDKLGTVASLPRIECQVPTMLSLGAIGLCPNRTQATIDLSMFFPSACPQPEIGALPGTGFDSHHTFAGAKMKLSSPSKPCKFTVAWSEGTRPQLAAMDDFGVLRFASDAAPTLLVPIVFHFLPPSDNCVTTDFACSYAGDIGDSLWTCAR